MSINQRIKKLVEIKGSGSVTRFAELLEVSTPYISKMCSEGVGVGLEPITKILNRFQDVNARWLITGEGDWIDRSAIDSLRYQMHSSIAELMAVEKYMPYMTEDELKNYRYAAGKLANYHYEDHQLERWKKLAKDDK